MSPSSLASRYEIISPEKAGGFTIMGSAATDIEYYVALALDKLDIPFLFQYEIMGGRVRRGGIVLDFLCLVPPLPIPLDIRGEHWHQPNQRLDDDLALAVMMSRGQYAEPVILYGGELQTEEQAYSTVKRELRI